MKFKVGGISAEVDVENIAGGMIDVMTEKMKATLAFGMIDSRIMDVLESQVRRKFDDLFKQFYSGSTPEELEEVMHELDLESSPVADREEFVRRVTKSIGTAIYGVAGKRGLMVV